MPRIRTWLFAPGHSEKILQKVFDAGADAVLLDAFELSGGAATRLDDGEFVDVPVAQRARQILRTVS